MSQEISHFLSKPTSLTEAMKFCEMISRSSFCSAAMRGKPGDIMLALQMGSEVGLSYMQALQNIAVINGKPCLYGDGALAVSMSSTQYEWHQETESGSVAEGNLTAHCTVKRKNAPEYTKTFSMDDAKKAGLWGKAGPWSQYPARMLQMRARAFAIRDQFADALRGINIKEEVEDYHEKQEKRAKPIEVKEIKPALTTLVTSPDIDKTCEEFLLIIDHTTTTDQLKQVFLAIKQIDFSGRPELFKKLIEAKDERKAKLSAHQDTGEVDGPLTDQESESETDAA